jgi:glycosyltransferase involved in cell wall biosynthesis
VTSPPEVTVVIPTRGRWSLLSLTLAGALGQEGVDHEVVIVDDGSRDETRQRLGEMGDARLRVVRNERPLGVAAARNRGIAEARGEWVAFLDDDDLWSPRKLRVQVDAAKAHGADFAYSAAVVADARLNPFYAPPLPDPETLAQELRLANVIPAGSSNVLARVGLIRAVGGLDERFSELDDWDLWIRLAHAGRAAASPEVLVAYVEHSANMPSGRETNLVEELDMLVRKHAAATPPIALEPDQLDFARWVARGHGRAGRRRQAFSAYLGAAVRHRSPTDVLRGIRVLVGGQPPRFRPGGRDRPAPEPAWLESYR